MHVKVIRRSEHPQPVRSGLPRELYFFYEKNTGVSHFHVEAGPDGEFPVEQAAGLLAMHCMVRGQSPSDYIVMVQAESDFLELLNHVVRFHNRLLVVCDFRAKIEKVAPHGIARR